MHSEVYEPLSLPKDEPEWFEDVMRNFIRLTITKEIICHIARAIENQIDFAHLGRVHKRSIRLGFDPTIKPRFELDEKNIRF